MSPDGLNITEAQPARTSPAGRLRCHRCGSIDLTLTEVCHEIGRYSRVIITAEGRLAALGEALFDAGDIQPELTRLRCHGCGHIWRPRRWFDGIAAGSGEQG